MRVNLTHSTDCAMPRPVVISGPSGSGKSTLVKRLMEEYKGAFGFSVSHTTRSPRAGEQNGVDYHFVTRDVMEKAIENKEFIETAEYSKNFYGTSIAAVENVAQTGRICILDIDSEGVKSIKKTSLNPRYIFIEPPSIKILEERLRGRGSETEESLTRRLDLATREIDYSKTDGSYDHRIVNDDVDIAYEKFRGILCADAQEVVKNLHKADH